MKKTLKYFLSITITLLFLFYFLSKINFQNVLDLFISIDINYLLAGLAFYLIALVIRSKRFLILVQNKKLLKMFSLVTRYNLINYIMPFKLGEISYVYLLKKEFKISYKRGTTSLVLARIFDLIVVVIFFIFGIFLLDRTEYTYLHKLFYLSLFLLLALCFFIYFLLFKSESFLRFLKKISSNKNRKILANLSGVILNIVKDFLSYKDKFFSVFFVSILNFAVWFLATRYILLSLNVAVPLKSLLFLIPLGILSGIIPVQGIAGVGTFESFWILGFTILKFPLDDAIIVSVGIHTILYVYVTVFAIIGKILKHIPMRREK